MDSGPSCLPTAQRMDGITPFQTRAQPGQHIHGYLANAHHVEIHGAQFNDIHGNIHQHTHTEKTELDKLQQFISDGAFYDSKARFPPPICHQGTRVEVLNIITEWIGEPYPSQRILWLNGPAGAGKSAIAQTVAERYKDSHLAASFFFLRNTPDRGVVDRLFTTLVWQLATSIPETRCYIETALKKERLLHSKPVSIQFNHLVLEVFKNLLRDKPGLHPNKSLVIIDGVDECISEYDQKLFLTLIANVKNVTRTVELDEKFAPNNDIRRYLKDEFSRIFPKRNISPLPSDSDVYHLISKASGQFIYASTVVKFIDDDDRDPREQLDIILKLRSVNSSPYAQLDQLYIQILSQQPDVRFLRDVFALIIGHGQPSFKFICRRLRIREEELRLKIRRMHSLLLISDFDILSYHLSLHDFFRDKRRAGKYHIYPMRVALVRLHFVRPIFLHPFAIGAIIVVITLGIILAVSVTKAATLKRSLALGLPLCGLAVAVVIVGAIWGIIYHYARR